MNLPLEFAAEISAKFGRLLGEERVRMGVAVETVAKIIGVPAQEVTAWEIGQISPIACLYFDALMAVGGKAYNAAAELWADTQIQAYYFHLRETLIRDRRKNKAALGAIRRIPQAA